jgi:hypothetical protein
MIRYTVDRFEGDTAVLENRETLENEKRPRSELPGGVKEGDLLVFGDGVWKVQTEETRARAASIRARFERLKNR